MSGAGGSSQHDRRIRRLRVGLPGDDEDLDGQAQDTYEEDREDDRESPGGSDDPFASERSDGVHGVRIRRLPDAVSPVSGAVIMSLGHPHRGVGGWHRSRKTSRRSTPARGAPSILSQFRAHSRLGVLTPDVGDGVVR